MVGRGCSCGRYNEASSGCDNNFFVKFAMLNSIGGEYVPYVRIYVCFDDDCKMQEIKKRSRIFRHSF